MIQTTILPTKERSAGHADEIAEHLRAAATRYFSDLDGGPLDLQLLRASTRPYSELLDFAVADGRRRVRVLVKAARGGGPNSTTGGGEEGRPRLVSAPDPALACLLEHQALSAIEAHFGALGDPRFGTIRVRGLIPGRRGFVMDRVDDPSLRSLLIQNGRGGRRASELRLALRNAGAWLRSYHGLALAETVPVRQGSRSDLTRFVGEIAGYLGSRPGQGPRMARLDALIRAEAGRVLPEALPLGLSHGDFAPRNILVGDGGRVTVCDTRARFRTAIYEDIGYFLASLRYGWRRLLTRGLLLGRDAVGDLEAAFLNGYFGAGEVPRRVVRLYTLIALLDRAASVAEDRERTRSRTRRLVRSVQLALLGRAIEDCARQVGSAASAARRVLLVGLANGYAGVETRVVSQARSLQGAVERCAVAVTPGSPLHERLRAEGIPCEPVPARRTDPRVLLQLRRIIRRGGYQVVDAHNIQSIFWGHLAAVLAGARGRVTTVHTAYREEYRGFRRRLYPALYAIVRPMTRQFVHVSRQLQERAEAEGAGARSTLIHNTVPIPDARSLRDRSLLSAWGFDDAEFVVAAVGRFFPVKGHADLIEAMARLRDRPGIRTVLVGEGPLREELEARVEALELHERVRFAGFRPDIPRVLEAADCLCLPSLWENLPYSALEAAACGTPIVATAVGGVPELLTHGATALLVPARDPAALAEAIRSLADDPEQAARLGCAARDLVRRSFSTNEMVRKTVDVYARALA